MADYTNENIEGYLDEQTICEAVGLGVGTLATIKDNLVLPEGSLVRVVGDEGDRTPAVELLIPAKDMGEDAKLRGDRDTGRHVIERLNDAGRGNAPHYVEYTGEYYWVPVDYLHPVADNVKENDDDAS